MRTKSFWFWHNRSDGAKTLADTVTVRLGQSMECSRVVVVPRRMNIHVVIMIVVMVVSELEPLLVLLPVRRRICAFPPPRVKS